MPQYMKINSRGIRIGQKNSGLHSGISIASADAFFLVVGKSALRTGLEASGGLLGVLVGHVIDRFSTKKPLLEDFKSILETNVEDLPRDIIEHPDWPADVRKGRAIFIPRESVVSVRYSFWKWGIFIETDEIEFRIEPPLFGRKKILQFLRDAGWEL